MSDTDDTLADIPAPSSAEPDGALPQNEPESGVAIVAIPAGEHNDLAASPVWRRITDKPYNADLFSVLRWLDCRDARKPMLGRASRPHFEAIRLAQEPSLSFAASAIAGITQGPKETRPRLSIYSFGLFGPNGPLPLHLTEYTRDRLRRYNDPTLARFADIFHHRLTLLFYRAWADAQATVSLDRPDNDRFTKYVASLTGFGMPALRARDEIADHAKFFQSTQFVRQTRNPEGLMKILSQYFRVPVTVQEFMPHWITLSAQEQSRLSKNKGNNRLGEDAVIGSSILDAQHKIRLRMGPMSLSRYRSLLPGTPAAKQIAAWVKNYIGLELFVDIQLVLKKEEVVQARLGDMTTLGWVSWLGERPSQTDADDLVLE
jgi:type VI secretion system protein ImpH